MHTTASMSILVSSNSGASSVACGSGDKLGREIKGFKHTQGRVGDDNEIKRFDFSICICVLGSLELVDICQWLLRIFLTLVPVGVLPTYKFCQFAGVTASEVNKHLPFLVSCAYHIGNLSLVLPRSLDTSSMMPLSLGCRLCHIWIRVLELARPKLTESA
jgi:hypothetical protein